MTTDFRALCVELTDCLEKADWPNQHKHVFEQWIYIARKALAEPKPPSLKEQALAVIKNSAICDHLAPEHEAILRRALEQLDD